MGTPSKKDRWNESKGRKNGLQSVFQTICSDLGFLLFFDPFFDFTAFCGIIFLNSSA